MELSPVPRTVWDVFRSPDEILAALDPEQREVASTLRGPVAVIAGAGTGKTRAITHRIAYGVATGVYRPTSVLAVTFTTRAAGELRGRLQRLGVTGVQARTFHSAALRQAQYFWPRAYGSELPRVLENKMSLVADSANRLRVQVDTPRLRDLVSEISWAKVSNVAPEDYARLAGQHHRSVSSMDPETVGRVFESYEATKRSRERIDFEDILLCAAALIAEHPQVAEQVRATYRHFVVDEYQDVSPLQQALLDLWRGDRSDVCVVGDPAQTIHSFAGAQASYLTGFARRHRDATVIRLVRDYRSTPQVVGVANQVMDAGVRSGTAVRLQAQQPAGPAVEFASAPDEQAEAGQIADWLSRLAQPTADRPGIEYREMAVLFRINANSPALEQALADRGIPYLVRGGERFYERPEVRQALLTLRNEARALDADGGGDVLEQVKAVLGTLGWTEQPPNSAGAVRERWESLAALVSVAEDLVAEARATAGTLLEAGSTGSPAIDLAAVSAELDRRADAQHVPAAQGVTLGTIHAAKGLEWDAVALYGMQEGSLPFVLATTPEELAEERRLLYVGITRARSRLRLSWSLTRNGGGSTRRPSRFLDAVLPPSMSAGGEGGGRQRRSSLAAHCRSCGKPLTGGAERKLGRHADCPSTYDERTLALLKEWRKQEASEQSLPAYCIFTDATLVALAESEPSTNTELSRVPGIGAVKIEKYGEAVLAILAAAQRRVAEHANA
ncbi:ATP-dependent DNA helicase UvrD2 [Microlunatus ginsengisoli]|uniref:DNA 3'-5' helicase n=1 Tax=Microlunatus ginsengisoli TaxID=363863 RepID=A0ABP6ZZV5_9ACTN